MKNQRILQGSSTSVVTMASDSQNLTSPVRIEFEADTDSQVKKGVHKPIFAPIFTKKGSKGARPKRVHLLVNPYSGKRKGRKIATHVAEKLREEGIKVEAHYSAYSGHLVLLASELTVKSGDLIVSVGGDGSFSEVLTGRMMLELGKKESFAIIPAGTGNSVAYDLNLNDVDIATNAILNGKKHAMDLARVELTEGLPGSEGERMVRYSHNLVTWGLGVDSNIKAEKMRWLGPVRYDLGILMAIMANGRRHATLTLDGVEVDDDFTLFLIQNSQTGGSELPLAPGASLDDGMMDIGILKKMHRRGILKAFGMLKKDGRHVFHPQVDYHRFKRLEITTEQPTAINIDGENLGSTPLTMEVLPSIVNVMIPLSE